MKRCLMSLLFVMMAGQAFAQDPPDLPEPDEAPAEETPPPPPDEIVEVVPPSERMTTNITFIVDTSGSMNNNGRVQMAITFARSLVERPQDQLMVAFLSFKDGHTRWPGLTPEETAAAKAAGMLEEEQGTPPPPGWVFFPGIPQLESAQRWLSRCGASGGTNPASAIVEALSENVRDLTVVLITDGEDFNVPQFLGTIASGQASRVERGLGRAVIFVIGVGPNAAQQQHLVSVGRSEGGGLFVVRHPEPPAPPAQTQNPDDHCVPPIHGPWMDKD